MHHAVNAQSHTLAVHLHPKVWPSKIRLPLFDVGCRNMASVIVHDLSSDYDDACPTDPDIAGLGVSSDDNVFNASAVSD